MLSREKSKGPNASGGTKLCVTQGAAHVRLGARNLLWFRRYAEETGHEDEYVRTFLHHNN